MNTPNKQKVFISVWQGAKLLWLAQNLSSLSFGIPLIAMVLFAANVDLSGVIKTALFYFMISFFVYTPLYGILSFLFLQPIKKILGRNHKEGEVVTKEESRAAERFFNAPIYLSVIIFIVSLLGFIFGLSLLWLGLIPELMPIIELTTVLGLAIGFIISIIQSSLIYAFLENYFRPQIELLNCFYPNIIKTIKIIKFPIFWKNFLLSLSSLIIAQIALGALYLGRVLIYSPEDIKNALTYIGVVVILTLFYVVIIAFFSSKNLVYPFKKLIFWADKIIKGETKEEIFLITNDEVADLITSLKRMYEELEGTKTSLEIRIKARTKELQNLTEGQEEIIRERVKEIQKRTEELEKFQKLAVGRELKMVELKKEIKKIKGQLESKD